jgi:hypothetical protein
MHKLLLKLALITCLCTLTSQAHCQASLESPLKTNVKLGVDSSFIKKEVTSSKANKTVSVNKYNDAKEKDLKVVQKIKPFYKAWNVIDFYIYITIIVMVLMTIVTLITWIIDLRFKKS